MLVGQTCHTNWFLPTPLPLACSQSTVADGVDDVADGRCPHDGCDEGDVDTVTALAEAALMLILVELCPGTGLYLLSNAAFRIDMPCCLSANISLTLMFGPAARLSLPGPLEMPVVTSACTDTTDPTSQPANPATNRPTSEPCSRQT